MFEKEYKLVLLDVLIIVFIEIVESFANSLPLLPNFANQFLKHVPVTHQANTRLFLLFLTLQILFVLEKLVQNGVLLGVVTEKEASKVMDFSAKPFRKVCEIQTT